MRLLRQMNNYKHHILVRKNELTHNFFRVLPCMSAESNGFFGVHPQLGSRKLYSYMFMFRALLTPLPYQFSPQTLERTGVVPSLPFNAGGRGILFPSLPHMRTRILDLQFSPVIFNFLLSQVPRQGYSETVCFIYLFIYSILFESFDYVERISRGCKINVATVDDMIFHRSMSST